MNEFEEWFEREFGRLGFYLTVMMYDPETFEPFRGVIYTDLTGHRLVTGMKVKPEMIPDFMGHGRFTNAGIPDPHSVIRDQINRFLRDNNCIQLVDFKPKKRINKFKL
jgi:hypothetical protein